MSTPPAVAARRIVQKFGGSTAMARTLSIGRAKPVAQSTVQSWCKAGIPIKWHDAVLDAANRAAIGLGPEDFFYREAAE
jgi:hypothetical protein